MFCHDVPHTKDSVDGLSTGGRLFGCDGWAGYKRLAFFCDIRETVYLFFRRQVLSYKNTGAL